ncbi:UBX2 (YML013W) [Zygosaccharomyces parabailii]|nr:UBX2 (YML013W) [Zygosaccharomyces parabailii]
MPVVTHNEQEFHLSHEEEDKLNHFQTITSFPEDDLSSIIKLLERDGWRLEMALSHYFDGNWKQLVRPVEPPPIPDRPPTPTPLGSPALANSAFRTPFIASDSNLVPALRTVSTLPVNYRERYRSVGLDKKDAGIWQWEQQSSPLIIILMFLPKLLWKLAISLGSLLWGVITFGFRSHLDEGPRVFNIPSTPVDKPLPLKDTLSQLSGDERSLERLSNLLCNDMTFNDALGKCEQEFKYLLLIFIGEIDFTENHPVDVNSQRLLSRVLTNETVLHFLEEHQDEILIYARRAAELEPWLVAKQLRIKYTPECLLVGNVLNSSGSLNGVTRLSVLSKLRVSSPKKFYHSLKITYDKFNPELIVNRTDRDELRLAREIKQLQDDAYQNSLRKDQLKKEQREIAEEEERTKRDLDLELQRTKKLEKTINNLAWLQTCYEHLSSRQSDDAQVKRATVQFRTSQGARLVLKFPSTTTLYEIYRTIGCYLYLNYYKDDLEGWSRQILSKLQSLADDDDVLCFKCNDGPADELSADKVPLLVQRELNRLGDCVDLQEPTFDFELISPFPRKKIEPDVGVVIKDVPELWPNGSLLLEEIIEDDGEDDETEAEE